MLFRLLPVHYAYRLNRSLRSPYSELEINNQLIFIHIPKAAGNALIKSLYGQSATGHDPLIRYKKYDSGKFNNFTKLAVVRNPWDKMVSSFFYLKQGGIGFFDLNFRNRYLADVEDFESFIAKMQSDKSFENKILSWIHFIPQIEFITINGEVGVDILVKLEELDSNIDGICERLKIKSATLMKDNQSKRGKYQDYYTTESRDYVASLYEQDIKVLGYTF